MFFTDDIIRSAGLSIQLVPRAAASVTHVDAVEQQGERGGVETELAGLRVGRQPVQLLEQ